jgi:hypothetical protein
MNYDFFLFAFFYRLPDLHNQSINNNLLLVIILKRETFLTYLVPKEQTRPCKKSSIIVLTTGPKH